MPRTMADAILKKKPRVVDDDRGSAQFKKPDRARRLVGEDTLQPNNTSAHLKLLKHWASVMRRIGRPITFSRAAGKTSTTHQCGTVRFGRTSRRGGAGSFLQVVRPREPLRDGWFVLSVFGSPQSRAYHRGAGAPRRRSHSRRRISSSANDHFLETRKVKLSHTNSGSKGSAPLTLGRALFTSADYAIR